MSTGVLERPAVMEAAYEPDELVLVVACNDVIDYLRRTYPKRSPMGPCSDGWLFSRCTALEAMVDERFGQLTSGRHVCELAGYSEATVTVQYARCRRWGHSIQKELEQKSPVSQPIRELRESRTSFIPRAESTQEGGSPMFQRDLF